MSVACVVASVVVSSATGSVTSVVGAVAGPFISLPSADASAENPHTDDDRLLDQELRRLADAAVLRVEARTCSGTQIGSGFVVDGRTITNRHLVAGSDEMSLTVPTATVRATVDRLAADVDLASGPALAGEPLVLAASNPDLGTPVVLAGHGGGGRTSVLAGTVHLYDDGASYGHPGEIMLIDARSTAGYSGGPVLDGNGEVVAVLHGYSPTVDLTLAVPVERLRSWLTDGPDSSGERGCDE